MLYVLHLNHIKHIYNKFAFNSNTDFSENAPKQKKRKENK